MKYPFFLVIQQLYSAKFNNTHDMQNLLAIMARVLFWIADEHVIVGFQLYYSNITPLHNKILDHRRCSTVTRAEDLSDSLIVFRVHGVQQSEERVRASQDLRNIRDKLFINLPWFNRE